MFKAIKPESATTKPAENINREKLHKLILDAFDATQGTANKDLVLVIGNTGAGKSTMINYLLRCPMEEEIDEIGMSRVVVKAGAIERAKIGHKLSISATLYPEAYQAPEGFYYCDCPGFGETRSPEHRITTSIATKITVNTAKQIKGIVVVLEQTSLIASRAQGLRDIFDTLQEFFSAPSASKQVLDLKRLSQSILFVITKATNKRLKYSAFFNAIRAEAASKQDSAGVLICDLMLTHGAKLIEVDPLDQGESRQALVKLVKHLKPLAPSYFGFPADANAKRELSGLMTEIAITGNQILNALASKPNDIQRLLKLKQQEGQEIQRLDQKLLDLTNSKVEINADGGQKSIQKLIDAATRRLENNRQEKQVVGKKVIEVSATLNELNSRELTEYWKETYDEEKIFGFVKIGIRNTKHIAYNGVIFEKAQFNSRGAGAEFTNEEIRPEAGIYRVTYITGPYEYGTGTVTIHVQKRFIPENATLVTNNTRTLKTLESEHEEATQKIKRTELHIADLEQKFVQLCQTSSEAAEENRKLMLQIHSKEKTDAADRVRKANKTLSTDQQILAQAKQQLPQQLRSFELVRKIAFVLGSDYSAQVRQFLQHYKQYLASHPISSIFSTVTKPSEAPSTTKNSPSGETPVTEDFTPTYNL